ncbi:MAG: MoxR family ATPase [Candidatus Magnetomorum sp.]|nr:MoxR family ATPase [Candidatus Magnetomorum sp.]
MDYPFTGNRKEPSSYAKNHTCQPGVDLTAPDFYQSTTEMVNAVNVALLMNMPLLLTGEPGSGKTQLAYRVAWELGFKKPLKFETKSTSNAKDLFYIFNTLARFHAAKTDQTIHAGAEFISYQALGEAILLANKPETVKDIVPKEFQHDGPKRSLVLIDEIDKAPRDFPNDILNEIESMYFKIPELLMDMKMKEVKTPDNYKPVVIITSNSEKQLPDAFLRRCVFHHVEFPNYDRMTQIITARLGPLIDNQTEFMDDALDLFYELRKPDTGLVKQPSTSELLVWIKSLRTMTDSSIANPLRPMDETRLFLGVLIKNVEDRDAAAKKVTEWIKTRQ